MIFISHQLAVIAQLSQRRSHVPRPDASRPGTADVSPLPSTHTMLLLAAHPSVEARRSRHSAAFQGEILPGQIERLPFPESMQLRRGDAR